jgi:hypothetical protein
MVTGNLKFYSLEFEDICRAHSLGLVPDDVLYFCLTFADNAGDSLRFLTKQSAAAKELMEKHPIVKDVLAKTIDRLVTMEENRGELPTEKTNITTQIVTFAGGVRHFVKLLAALGEADFYRGYVYYAHINNTKKAVLSQLLKACRPAQGDTPQMLKDELQHAKISEKRLIQAALYAPQWAQPLEEALGIEGLKGGVWFFHAHINEDFSAEKETEVAIFSDISPERFNDGAFDKDWFFEAYHTLGEKRFNELYKNAKYITTANAAHKRSQLYTDAVLGRLDKEKTKAEISEKRHQEKLRAYALIPLDEKNKNDALERYEFIQQFKKESRQFGAQRQASEGKACQTALENLAITTGYQDADRMTWVMEGKKIESLRHFMQPHEAGGVEVALAIDEDGTPNIIVQKNGKPLKALPKEAAKQPYVSELKEAVRQLKEQKRRARYSFEMAMVSRLAFSVAEVSGLLRHPILKGMTGALVFAAGENMMGFPVLDGKNGELLLTDAEGKSCAVPQNAALIFAHPFDFVTGKCWSAYQKYLYQNQIVQPFKQVFREYYPLTEDEKAAVNLSRRYAGNQVQPKKAAALLKSRGWTVDYEEGVQRVWRKENLVAHMYAMADWFSPADIEAPTIEEVCFYQRGKHEPVAFADIPPVVFSETMRDIDLAVSVAHAGGVDPEASHSTIEMRVAIARELLSLLKVANVSFQTAHAQIKGRLGEYSVHMGSGVVHKSGVGMIAVLPVHSQARGRIFLPFADDDPKTAEIMSKILLFADDTKIKDPSILGQIGE